MCGIVGIYHYAEPLHPVDVPTLAGMTRSIAHRGPDGEGLFVDGPVGFGNRRLAIVDLSPAGDQPMRTADGSCCLTYNGEFYNHSEFRPRLVQRGVAFRGSSDTETLLYLLVHHGPGALAAVAGIFGFAFWDGRHQRLILARDPLGVKQLYYHDDGRRIVFGSEIKALFESPDVPREPDPEGVNQYLHFHAPIFDRTFFKGIRQLRPGEYIEVTRFGLRRRIYWTTDGFEPRFESPDQGVAHLRTLLDEVVGQQLMADVPVGSFFSGGVDSSTVAAFAKRNGRPPRCFGIHFTNQGVIDERPYQEAAAKALGLELELTTVDGSTYPEDFLRLSYFQDQPIIGAAMVPMYYVSRLAARQVKVCLGGQAADEIFGGYARYALVNPGHVISSWFLGRRPVVAGAEADTASRVGGNLLKQVFDLKNMRRLGRLARYESWSQRYFRNFALVPEHEWKRVLPEAGFVSRARARETFEAVLAQSPASTPVDKILHWDMQTYLPGLFHQDDRMSMANSLESRVPLADPRLVRFAFHTRFDLKLRGSATKWILRQAVSNTIPADVLNRRKVGFDTPAESWMRGRHQGFVRELLLSSRARARGFWSPREIEAILSHRDSPHWFSIVWKLAAIEAWACVFLDRIPASAHNLIRKTA